jgi:hypothetical protein
MKINQLGNVESIAKLKILPMGRLLLGKYAEWIMQNQQICNVALLGSKMEMRVQK